VVAPATNSGRPLRSRYSARSRKKGGCGSSCCAA